MSGILRIAVIGGIALAVPLVFLKMMNSPSPAPVVAESSADGASQAEGAPVPGVLSTSQITQAQADVLLKESERRYKFINGWEGLREMTSMIERYHFDNYELPTSADQLSHGFPRTHADGADAYEFDPEDASVTMYFQDKEDIEDGAVTMTPTVDENNEKMKWECWSSDYPDIKAMIATCTYYEP